MWCLSGWAARGEREQLQGKGQIGLLFVPLRISRCREVRSNYFFSVKIRSFCSKERNGYENTGLSWFYVWETSGMTYRRSFLGFQSPVGQDNLSLKFGWVGITFSSFVSLSHNALYAKYSIRAYRAVTTNTLLRMFECFDWKEGLRTSNPRIL